jgi:GMP synthase (glutamine-hydrolysing)
MTSFDPILAVVHQPTSNPGLVGQVLRQVGFTLDMRCPAQGDPLPATMKNHHAAIVFGGPMSANDDHQHQFIRDELAWIGTVLQSEKPFLGICLGAQLLARVLGARVTPHPEGIREIGYFPIQPTPLDRTLFPQPMMVYHWHQEGFDLPSGADLLASGQTFKHQAFRYGPQAYGLQFHPEITALMINHWTTEGGEQLVMPGAQSRFHHLGQHRLYGREVDVWLRKFLRHWLATAGATEAAWHQCHGHAPLNWAQSASESSSILKKTIRTSATGS